MAHRVEYFSKRWRRFVPRNSLFCGPIPVLPLINVGFLIMLFNMLGSAFVLEPAISVELPITDFTSGSRYGCMVVTLTQEGKVFFNDELMTMDKLEFAIKQAARDKNAPSLVIEADARSPYGAVMRIMNMATAARIPQVDLATRPFYRDPLSHETVNK